MEVSLYKEIPTQEGYTIPINLLPNLDYYTPLENCNALVAYNNVSNSIQDTLTLHLYNGNYLTISPNGEKIICSFFIYENNNYIKRIEFSENNAIVMSYDQQNDVYREHGYYSYGTIITEGMSPNAIVSFNANRTFIIGGSSTGSIEGYSPAQYYFRKFIEGAELERTAIPVRWRGLEDTFDIVVN